MKMNLDGSLEIEKGEVVPFICPKCSWAIEYDSKLVIVNCFHCGHKGFKDEFEQEITLKD